MTETALAVVPQTSTAVMPMVDIEATKAWLDNFRNFVSACLDESKGHFGKMPGVKRDFLHQPGAEILYHAFEARPEYDVIEHEIDWDRDFCYFIVKCRVVHMSNGLTLGEATGACSSKEYDSLCPVHRPIRPQGQEDMMVECPEHGINMGKRGFEWGQGRGERIWHIGCTGRTPQPLARSLQNVQSKANKRAMVAAIRTVGCVSERFSQDPENSQSQPEADNPPVQRPQSRSRSTSAAQSPKSNGQPATTRSSSNSHSGASQSAGSAPSPASSGEPHPAIKAGFTGTDLVADTKRSFVYIKENGVDGTALRAYAEDAGLLEVGAPLSYSIVAEWMKRNPNMGPYDFALAVVTHVVEETAVAEAAAEGVGPGVAPVDVIDGESREISDDDIPFD